MSYGPFGLTRRRYLLQYDVHSWIGILGGLIFFICCFSGGLALFEEELTAWESPASRVAAEPADFLPVDELYRRSAAALPPAELGIYLRLPTDWHPTLQARALLPDDVRHLHLDPINGQALDVPTETAFAFLTHLHTDLHLPRPWGRYLVGLIGIFMLATLIAGVFSHIKVAREAFAMRSGKTIRLTLSDLHKQLGLWGLAFGAMIAFTGAIIGLLGLVAPFMVLSAFGGDVERATLAYSGPNIEAAGAPAEMRSLDAVIEEFEQRFPDHQVDSLLVRSYGDRNAEVGVNLVPAPWTMLVGSETHRVSLVDGTAIHTTAFTDRGIGMRVWGMVTPLHYGLFGGMSLKLFYFVLGALLSIGIVTGSMMWLEKRQEWGGADAPEPVRYRRLARFTLGVCAGLVVASIAAITAGRLIDAHQGETFWAAWTLSILLSLIGPRPRTLAFAFACFSAAGLLLLGIGDLLLSETLTASIVRVDATLIVLGLLCGFGAAFLRPRQHRPVAAPESLANHA